jgi:hypothetical protein
MNVKINQKSSRILFDSLLSGELFAVHGIVYMKLSAAIKDSEGRHFNCVNQTTGELMRTSSYTEVTHITDYTFEVVINS